MSDLIPVDLVIDIFSRVPAKTIARFRCLSKFWESILGRPDFGELFLTRSSTCPRLLFTFGGNSKLFFYSSPHPQNLNDENSFLAATKYHTLSPKWGLPTVCPLRGLVGIQMSELGGPVKMIYNPITGESIPLLEVGGFRYTKSYLGYDPIDKRFKVLFLCVSGKHRVLTLDTEKKMVWRRIESKPHYFPGSNICINGVLYYQAQISGSINIIVCFDVRSENFSFINVNENTLQSDSRWTLINYKGQLGAILYKFGMKTEITLLVLQDVGKHKWTKHTCILPPLLTKLNTLFFLGMTSTSEIVVLPCYRSDPFYVFYFNPEKDTFRRVGIKGFEEQKNHRIIDIFSDYIEDVRLMQSV